MPITNESVNIEYRQLSDQMEAHRSLFIDWLNFKVFNTIANRNFLHELFPKLEKETIERGNSNFFSFSHPERILKMHYHIQEIEEINCKISSRGLSEIFKNRTDYTITDFLKWILRNCKQKLCKGGEVIPAGITRIDFALDDFEGLIDLKKISRLEEDGHTVTRLDKVLFLTGWSHKERSYRGRTMYIGDRAASTFIRFYDKYAKCKEQKIEIDENIKIWNRFEIELKDSRANVFTKNYINNPHFCPYEALLAIYRFTKKSVPISEKNKQRFETADFYSEFLKNTKIARRLKVPQLVYDLENLERYVEKTASSAYDVYARVHGEDELLEVIRNATKRTNENPKYRNIIEKNAHSKFDYSDDKIIKKFKKAS